MTSPDGRYLYNSPPNWPAPPEGWIPPEGWQPDAAWPPAPEGWQFWLDVNAGGQPERDPQRHGFVARLDPRKAYEDAQARKAERGHRLSFHEAMAEAKQKADTKKAVRQAGQGDRESEALPQTGDLQVVPLPTTTALAPNSLAPTTPPAGFLAARREKKAEAQLARAQADAEAARLRERQELLARRTSLQEQIDFIQGWPGNVGRDCPDFG